MKSVDFFNEQLFMWILTMWKLFMNNFFTWILIKWITKSDNFSYGYEKCGYFYGATFHVDIDNVEIVYDQLFT